MSGVLRPGGFNENVEPATDQGVGVVVGQLGFQCQKPLTTILNNFRCDAPGQMGSRRPGTRTKGENVCLAECRLAQDGARLLEVGLGFAWEADDDVGG